MEKWQRGGHGNTFGGNPISCAAANATLDLVSSHYMANAASVGAHFLSRLHCLASEFDCIGQVRGRGLMIGMELIEPGPERTPAPGLCDALITRAWRNGLVLLSCGVGTVRFTPPLCVSNAEVDEAIALLRVSLSQCLAERSA